MTAAVTTPAVSVVLPVCNAVRYVSQAIDSILRQTFDDFELIAIDDGSTDGSTDILRSAAAKDRRVCLVTRPNRGLVPSLNEGIALARADLIARMDADDISLPHRLAVQVAAMRRCPAVLCLGGSFEVIDSAGRRLARRYPPAGHAEIDRLNLKGTCAISHPTAIFRRDAIRSVGGYRESFMCAEDLDLWLRLAEIGTLANLSDIVLQYRMHADSVSERRAAVQLERTAAACREACDRRGVSVPFEMRPWRPTSARDSRRRFILDYGWSAYMLGERRTARAYGAKAISLDPFRPDGWKLLLVATLRKSPHNPR